MDQSKKMDPSMEQQIAQINETLRRLCAETDLAIRALQVLLEAQGLKRKAEQLGEDLDNLHAERLEAQKARDTETG